MIGIRDVDGLPNGANGSVAFAKVAGDAKAGVTLWTARSSALVFCDWGKIFRLSSFGGTDPRLAAPLADRTLRIYVTKKGSHVHFILAGLVVTLVGVRPWFVFGGGLDLDVFCNITFIGLVGILFKPVFADSSSLAVPSVHSGAEGGATRAPELVSILQFPSLSFGVVIIAGCIPLLVGSGIAGSRLTSAGHLMTSGAVFGVPR